MNKFDREFLTTDGERRAVVVLPCPAVDSSLNHRVLPESSVIPMPSGPGSAVGVTLK